MKKKKHSRSERIKYLDTMMADMGVSSLSDLSSNEERKRWLKAVTPSKSVQRKLKEMGYDLFGNNNKRSLGRFFRMNEILKRANRGNQEFMSLNNELKIMLGEGHKEVFRYIVPLGESSPRLFDKDLYSREIYDQLDYVSTAFPDADTEGARPIVDRMIDIYSDTNFNVRPSENLNLFFNKNPSHTMESFSSAEDAEMMVDLLSEAGYAPADTSSNSIFSALNDFKYDNNLSAHTGLNKAVFVALAATASAAAGAVGRFIVRESTRIQQEETNLQSANRDLILAVGLGELQKIEIGSGADLSRSPEKVLRFIGTLDGIIVQLGLGAPRITSVFRGTYDQARVMLDNYNSMVNRVGYDEADEYLTRLYAAYDSIDDIAEIFRSQEKEKDEKIREVEQIISSRWTPGGHRLGTSIDIAGIDKQSLDLALDEAEKYFEFSRLWEPEPGAHYHLTIRRELQQNSQLA